MFKLLLSLFLLLFLNTQLYSQSSVKELDRVVKKDIRGKLKKQRTGRKDELLVVYTLKSTGKIFSIMKREKFQSGNKADSLVSYQFSYISDTLLRVFYTRLDVENRRNGVIILYLNADRIIAMKKSGDIELPDMDTLKDKSSELTALAENFINPAL